MKRVLLAAALCIASTTLHAQSALEYAAAGMGTIHDSGANLYGKRGSLHVNARFSRRLIRSEGMLAGVYGPLADKAREIEGACGSRVTSGVRRGARVAGTHRLSLHSSGHAVDMQGNPACIYAHLRGWEGGYSTDYGRVRHVHISLGGREDGRRFAHRVGRVRYAWR